MSPKWRNRLVVCVRVLVLLTASSSAALLAGEETNRPENLNADLVFWVAVTAACLAALEGGIGAYRGSKAPGRDAAEARTQKTLMALMVEIAKKRGVDVEYLGVSVWVPRIRWVRQFGPIRVPERVLVRVIRFRMIDHPQATEVTWRRGKGAIGACWATKVVIHRDWHDQAKQHSSPTLSADDFGSMGSDVQDGFEHQEFVAIASKYSEVLATPVLSEGGAVLGVISIDIAFIAGVDSLVLGGFEEQCDTAATLIRDDLDRLYPLS